MFENLKSLIIENNQTNREFWYKIQAIIRGEIGIDKIADDLPLEMREDLEDIIRLRNETREDFLKTVADEIAIQEDAKAKVFAAEQINKLLKMGYSKYRAQKILNIVGPQYCIEVAIWVKQLLNKSEDIDFITVIIRGLDKAPFGRNRIEALLRKLELPVPYVSTTEELRKFLAGAKEAL